MTTHVATVLRISPFTLIAQIGAGRPVDKGYRPRPAVPFNNALHRFWPPVLLTTVAGIALDRAAGYSLRNADGGR